MKNKSELKSTGLPLNKENYILLGVGFLIIILGFILMAGGGSDDPNVFNQEELFSFRRIFLAPFLVLAGYVVVLVGIMRKPKD